MYWVLDQGLVNQQQYLEWARDHFGIPVLQDEYFDTKPPLPQVSGPWSPWLLPVNEWDGVLFVACVEPPSEPSGPHTMRFVLASPETLRRGLELNAENALESANAEPMLSPPLPSVAEGPVKPPTKVTLQIDMENPLGSAVGEASLSIARPEDSKRAEEKPAPPPLASPRPLLQLSDDLDISLIKTNQTTVAAAPPPAMTPPTPTAPPPVAARATPPAPPAAVAPPRPAPTFTPATLPPAPAQLEAAQNESQAFAWAFLQLKSLYSHVMALRTDQQVAHPWLWSSQWSNPEHPIVRANSLEQPSLFRIAARTRRPYHGFVVANDLHKEFFSNWGFSTLPACATAVPILVNNELWGLLLAIGDAKAESADALSAVESIAGKLSGFLEIKKAAA